MVASDARRVATASPRAAMSCNWWRTRSVATPFRVKDGNTPMCVTAAWPTRDPPGRVSWRHGVAVPTSWSSRKAPMVRPGSSNWTICPGASSARRGNPIWQYGTRLRQRSGRPHCRGRESRRSPRHHVASKRADAAGSGTRRELFEMHGRCTLAAGAVPESAHKPACRGSATCYRTRSGSSPERTGAAMSDERGVLDGRVGMQEAARARRSSRAELVHLARDRSTW